MLFVFLLSAVATDPKLSSKVTVPVGFADDALPIPRPSGATIFVTLRDDPAVINPVQLPVMPQE
jgi:hypothetical protein